VTQSASGSGRSTSDHASGSPGSLGSAAARSPTRAAARGASPPPASPGPRTPGSSAANSGSQQQSTSIRTHTGSPAASPARTDDTGSRAADSAHAAAPSAPGSSTPPHRASSSVAPTAGPRPVTRASKGIKKPKQYTDGTVRWGMSAITEEPASLQVALRDPS
jgi:hypothetical protein